MTILFHYDCSLGCKGTGILPPKRPGIDWPERCPCKARKTFSQYELARKLEEDPKAIERVVRCVSGGDVSRRVLDGLVRARLAP